MILPSYIDADGRERFISEATRTALQLALGSSRSDPPLVDPVRVIRVDAEGRGVLLLQLPAGTEGRLSWEVQVTLEDGGSASASGSGDIGPDGRTAVHLPPVALPPGYHRLRASARADGVEWTAAQLRVVAPRTCHSPAAPMGDRRGFGLLANLYSVRSPRNWGVGDLGDLKWLHRWAAEQGMAFVGVNPLHVLRNREPDVSPYGPVSRLFLNPLYLDVEAVPEMAGCAEARRLMESPVFRDRLAACRASARISYGTVASLKDRVLRALHRSFASAGTADGRRRAYAAFRESQGPLLDAFATFRALEESREAEGLSSRWPDWPGDLRDPRSQALHRFREDQAQEVDYHRWLQFETDRQLRAARDPDLRLGLYRDLAVGSVADGFDAWAFPDLFVQAASLGAPPDPYSETGQDWGLPPVHPHRLREDGYEFWIRMLQTALAHGGMLRLDHVMGVQRQFWIPRGREGRDGAYVAYPAEDLLGILALESVRHGAVIVGEDLGTVPAGFSELLDRWGVLSTRVLYFERTAQGSFRPPSAYPARALVSANTHDLPTLPAFWSGRDLEIRREVGQIPDDDALEHARAERARDRELLEERLRQEDLMPEATPDPDRNAAVHAMLARTPARLVGVSLDDLAGEEEPVNLPGVGNDRRGNWSRRLKLTLEEIASDPEASRSLAALSDRALKTPPEER